MAYNTFETIDNTLRGEPYGQMTPEGQKLWDEYQALLSGQKAIPMRNLNLRSGGVMQIPDPGIALKNKMLSRTLGGMTGTGMGTRAAAQPGLFSQLAPLFIAAGIKDPKEIKRLLEMFSGKPTADVTPDLPSSGTPSGFGEDWWSGSSGADLGTDWGSLFSGDDLAATGGDWGWLD
jgi:hypothetical protein